MEQLIINALRDSDLTFPLLLERLQEKQPQNENMERDLAVWLRSMMKYDTLNPDYDYVTFYPKAGDLWFKVVERKKKK
jgi:hypothetical protein